MFLNELQLDKDVHVIMIVLTGTNAFTHSVLRHFVQITAKVMHVQIFYG